MTESVAMAVGAARFAKAAQSMIGAANAVAKARDISGSVHLPPDAGEALVELLDNTARLFDDLSLAMERAGL